MHYGSVDMPLSPTLPQRLRAHLGERVDSGSEVNWKTGRPTERAACARALRRLQSPGLRGSIPQPFRARDDRA